VVGAINLHGGLAPPSCWSCRAHQVELYFSIVQRKALTPNDLGSLEELAERLTAFGRRYREIARPFEWTFTRSDLERVLERIDAAAREERGLARLRLAA